VKHADRGGILNERLMFQNVWARLALAPAMVALAAVLRIWPLQTLGSSLVWLTFYPAVMVVAILGGFFSGLLATALACLTAVFLWPHLVAHPFIAEGADWLGMAVFVVTCMATSGVAEAVRRVQSREAVHRALFESMDEGFCVVEMIYDPSGIPVDYRFVEINPAFEKQTGLQQALGKTIRQMVPDHDAHWFEIYGKVAETGKSIRFENPATAMHRYYDVYAFRIGGSESKKVGILFKDMTERKELQDKLEEQANTDALTGCDNRRHFLEHAEWEILRIRRYGGAVSMLMLDLDHFKNINDTHGHSVGDLTLKKFVQVCKGLLRDVDVIGRLGGEEFAIMLPETRIERGLEVADRLCRAVAAAEIPLADSSPLRFTTSIGVASLAADDLHADEILRRADQALYKAKNSGRNRACA
jgi:diguanylate cyclase (GGDEF)-like protein